MKIIYFMRHSEALKPVNMNNSDSLQIQNEKWGLTIEGKISKRKKQASRV